MSWARESIAFWLQEPKKITHQRVIKLDLIGLLITVVVFVNPHTTEQVWVTWQIGEVPIQLSILVALVCPLRILEGFDKQAKLKYI